MARGTCSVCHAQYAGDVRFCPRDGTPIVEQTLDDALIGATIDGRYLIRRLIGRGGMGAVYEADHVGLDKRVAIKFMLDVDRELVARFRREARAAARIEHDNVVQIFDVGTANGREFIVMEYLDGRDLGSVLKDGALPASRALAIAQQILHGLHAIHEAGIVHRDIKPGNILLVGDDQHAKIMDFGISAIDGPPGEPVTRKGQIVGTPQFMAPEQLVGGQVDRRADIYAVALTLHAMLTGKLPYTVSSVHAIAAQQQAGPPELDVAALGIPAHVADALRCALSHAPSDRFATALELAAALEGKLPRDLMARTAPAAKRAKQNSPRAEAETVAERRRSGPDRTRRSGRWLVVLAVAGAAAAAIAIVTFVVLPHSSPATSTPNDAAAVATDPIAAARAAEHDGKLDVAIARYLEAFTARSDPELLFRVGELYERLDRTRDAVHYFESYLERAPDAKDRDAVLARIARLRPPPPVAAGVADAGVTDAPPPKVASKRTEPKPDPTCRCVIDGGHGWLCTKKDERPMCKCTAKSPHWALCPTPFEHCPKPCPKYAFSGTLLDWSCSIDKLNTWWKQAEPGTACRGYSTVELPKTDPSQYKPTEMEGTWECNFCYAPNNRWDTRKRFAVAGKPDDECTGYLAEGGGELKKGHVICKANW